MRTQQIFRFIFSLTIMLAMSSSFAIGNVSAWANFDRPQSVTEIKLGKSANTDGDIIQTCYAYGPLNVIEIDDPGIMGAVKVIIRSGHQETCEPYQPSANDLVLDNDASKKIHFADPQYFQGLYANLLVTGGADSFGGGRYVEVFNIADNHLSSIFHDVAYDKDHSMKFTKSDSGIIGLDYWRQLDCNCSLADKNKKDCWAQILKKEKIEANLVRPECRASYQAGHTPRNAVSMVFTHVKIADLEHPKVEYLTRDRPVCQVSP